jgi:hypothetical protein
VSVAGVGAVSEGRFLRRAFLGTFVVAVLLGLIGAARAHAFIYWADPLRGLIGRASIDGANVDGGFITGANQPCGVTLDNQYLYWANAGNGTIGRAKLDGTDVNESFITGASQPCGPSTETGTGILYWANPGSNAIATAFSNGTGVNQSLISNSGTQIPQWTTTLADEVYWPGFLNNTIWRAFGDGTGTQAFVSSGQVDMPLAIAVHNGTNGIYWVNDARTSFAQIGHADIDGSNPNGQFLAAQDACGVALDDTYMYWTSGGLIGRALLNGGSPNTSFSTTTSSACGLAVNADTAEAIASPSSLDFGNVLVNGTAGPLTVTLTNSSSTSVSLQPGTSTITGPDAGQFSIPGGGDNCDGQTIAPGGNCTISVDFSPTSLGGKAATLSIPSNDPDSPNLVTLSGAGTDPDESITPTSIPFGSRLVNTQTPAQTVTLTNEPSASAPDYVGQATLVGADAGQFGIASDGCSNTTVAIGASCQISVNFAPTATGPLVASLSIPSDDPTSPATVALSGTGTAPDESVLPGALQFGNQLVGTNSPTQSITVANTANASGPLVLGSASLGGASASQFDKVSDNCSGRALSPGDDCQISVRFVPGSAGAAVASLQIPSNGGSPSVPLAGNGILPANVFQLGTPRRLKNGTAIVPVTIPGAGTLTLSGSRGKTQTLTVNGPGTVELTVQANRKARNRLKGKGVKVIVEVVFTPRGGQAANHFATMKLRRGR